MSSPDNSEDFKIVTARAEKILFLGDLSIDPSNVQAEWTKKEKSPLEFKLQSVALDSLISSMPTEISYGGTRSPYGPTWTNLKPTTGGVKMVYSEDDDCFFDETERFRDMVREACERAGVQLK